MVLLQVNDVITIEKLSYILDFPFDAMSDDATGKNTGIGSLSNKSDTLNFVFKFDPKNWAEEQTVVTITDIEPI